MAYVASLNAALDAKITFREKAVEDARDTLTRYDFARLDYESLVEVRRCQPLVAFFFFFGFVLFASSVHAQSDQMDGCRVFPVGGTIKHRRRAHPLACGRRQAEKSWVDYKEKQEKKGKTIDQAKFDQAHADTEAQRVAMEGLSLLDSLLSRLPLVLLSAACLPSHASRVGQPERPLFVDHPLPPRASSANCRSAPAIEADFQEKLAVLDDMRVADMQYFISSYLSASKVGVMQTLMGGCVYGSFVGYWLGEVLLVSQWIGSP